LSYFKPLAGLPLAESTGEFGRTTTTGEFGRTTTTGEFGRTTTGEFNRGPTDLTTAWMSRCSARWFSATVR